MESDSDPDNPDVLAHLEAAPAKKKKLSDYFKQTNDNAAKETENDVSVIQTSASSPGTSSEIKYISADDLKKVQQPQSLLWLFFTKVGSQAKCNKCGTLRATPDSSTTTLKNHLKNAHQKSYEEYLRLQDLRKKVTHSDKKTESSAGSQKQTSLKDSLKGVFKYDPKGKKAKTITRAIAKFICKGVHAYTIVEEPAFLQLLHLLDPHYSVPSRTTSSRQVIPALFKELKERIQKELAASTKLESVSITTDLRNSRAGDSFMTFTLQFINSEFQMKNITLDCVPFPGKHDAEALYAKIRSVLPEWDLEDEEIKKYIVADNGRNISKALRNGDLGDIDLDLTADQDDISGGDQTVEEIESKEQAQVVKLWIHISCYNHTMQLAVEDTKKSLQADSVIDKVSSHVGRYNKSGPAREGLEQCQKELKLPQHCLIQMVVTRWDSEVLMLERYLEQKEAVVSEQGKAGVDSLSVQEWKMVEGFVQALRIVANFTADMGSHSKPTFSMVLPVLF